MPTIRICRTRGCSNLTDGTFYCHVHTKHRDGRTTRSSERFSRTIIANARGRCQLAYQGCTGKAEHAHKIGRGEHVQDPSLYLAACNHCHGVLHGSGSTADPLLIF